MKRKTRRILGRNLAREVSAEELAAAHGAPHIAGGNNPPGTATMTLRYPPDFDFFGG
jgi:hypothetical protein